MPTPILEVGPFALSGAVSEAPILAHDPSYLLAEGTLAFTFTADSVDGRRFLFSKDSSGFDDGGHAGVYIENGVIKARFQDLGDTYVVETGALISAGTQHHVAVTFGAGGLTIFVDGVEQAAIAYGGGLLGNEEPIVLGANQWASGNGIADKLVDGFDGSLTNVSLYDSALDGAAIADLSQAASNDPPLAGDDALSAESATPLVILVADLLANDSDADGDPLSLLDFSQPTSGQVTDNGDGSLTYTPADGFFGDDSFTYRIGDGQGGEATATVTVTVADQSNTAPSAADDAYAVDEDGVLAIAAPGVLANDQDTDGDALTAASETGPTNGSLALAADGSFTYTPDANFNGSDSFTYAVSDGRGGSATATVSITVNAVNDAPSVGDAVFQVSDNAADDEVVGQVSASDLDGDALTYAIIAGNEDGVFDIDANGQIFLADASGLDATTTPSYDLTVEASDGSLASTALITIDINDSTIPPALLDVGPFALSGAVSEAPILAHDPSYLLAEGTLAFTFTADSVDGRRFLFSKDSSGFDDGGHAGVYIENGVIKARFQDLGDTYVVETGALISAGTQHHVAVTFGAGGLTIFVDGVEQAAIAYGGGLLGNEEPIVLGANQWASGNGIADKLVDGFDGNLTNVSLYDSALDGVAIADLSQAASNDPPLAGDDALSAESATPLVILVADLLANDSDADGDPLSLLDFSQPTSGQVTDNGDGSLTYTPADGFFGDDSFTYRIGDGQGGEATATVTVTVADQSNTAPSAADDAYAVDEDGVLAIAAPGVLANDQDTDGDALTAASETGPTNGSLALAADGSFTYTPDANFNGSDSFTYAVSDGRGGSATATVSITVNAVNDAPSVGDAVFQVSDNAADDEVVGQVSASDLDGDALTYAIIAGNEDGVFDIDANGQIFLADASGLDATTTPSYDLTVEASDGSLASTALITIDINDSTIPPALLDVGPFALSGAVSEAPILAHDPSYLLAEGTLAFTFTADSVDGRRFLFSKDSSGFDDGGHAGVYIENGVIKARFQDLGDTYVVETGALISAGTQHHVAVTFGAGGLTIFVDGVEQAAIAYGGGLLGNEEPIVLGANQWASGNGIADKLVDGFDGNLTNVSLYDSALDGVAIADLSQAASNDPPLAGDDALSAESATPLVILVADLLANDSDADGDPLSLLDFSQPTSGQVTDNGDGSLTYTPADGFFGDDSFTYRIGDGQGGEATATVTVTVADQSNTAPSAADDAYAVDEDGVLAIAAPGILANDQDTDGDALTAASETGPTNGSLALAADGSFTYTPDANFNGSDSFTYAVSDGRGGSATATVSITVNAVNDAPSVGDASFQVSDSAADDEVVGQVSASDLDGDALTYAIIAGNEDGVFDIDANGQIFLADASGLDATTTPSYDLTVEASDGSLASTAFVTIDVNDDSFPTAILNVGPVRVEGDIEQATIVPHDAPYLLASGTLALSFVATAVDGRKYLLSKDSSGFDTGGHVGIYVEDGVVAVRIQDTATTYTVETGAVITPGQTHHVAVTFGGPDGLAIYVDGVQQASDAYVGGLLGNREPIVLGANQWTSGNLVADDLVDPFQGYIQKAELYDVLLDQDQIATLSGQVSQIDLDSGAPLPVGEVLSVIVDTTLDIDISTELLANDSDPDSDPLIVSAIGSTRNGTLTNNGDGTLTYVPDAGFLGNDSFTYQVSDGSSSSEATVVISVAEPGPEPAPPGGQSPDWQLISSTNGDIPIAETPENTAAQVLDVDRDGLMDFVIAGRRGDPAMTWYRQDGDGGWEAFTLESAELDIEAGGTVYDVDGDGDLDIFMGGDSRSNEVWWWENPYPVFDPNVDWTRHIVKSSGGKQQHDMIFGDFDGDGDDEFVFWNQKGSPSGLYISEIPADPTAGEWSRDLITDTVREGLAKGDIDGDGIEDIVTGGYWYKWNSGTDFTEIEIDRGFRQGQSAVGDFNEDGQLEILFSSGDLTGPLLMYQVSGDPTVASNWFPTDLLGVITDQLHSLDVADIDQDGHLDIFAAEMNLFDANPDAKTWVLFGDGTGQFRATEVAVGIDNHESTLADLDGDGDLDILGKGFQDNEINIWYNTLNEITLGGWERNVIEESRPWRAIFEAEGDIDGDGLLDIITGGWWYRNPGSIDGAWERNTIGDPLNNMAAVYDFDGDGDLDILGTQGIGSSSNSDFAWAQNDGFGNFTIFDNVESGVGAFLQGTTVGSFSPGGPLTVALSWQGGTGGTQTLTVPDDPTSGTWTWSQISPLSQGEGLDHGDIDGDGDDDILLGFKWLRNDDGVWTDFTLHLEPPKAEPDRVHLVDMDGDNDLDALVGYGHESSITTLAWYEQPDDETAIWTEHLIASDLVGNPQSVDFADMDADGDFDVVVGEHLPQDPGNLGLFVFENSDGVGDAWTKYTVHLGDEHHDAAQLADFDQDGDLDIYSIGWTHDNIYIYENLTNGFDSGVV